MSVPAYSWPAVAEFRNRSDDLAALEAWWRSPDRDPLNMYGRRRVGKSWLFRRFAHQKPALVLVAYEDSTLVRVLRSFAETLEPVLGVKPDLGSLADLFATLYRLAEKQKMLVVIDEFPYLLGSSRAARARALSSVQAVMEEWRDRSQLKLILAGSLVAEMERLQSPKSPLYGRLRAFDVRPLTFEESTTLLEGRNALDNLVRYSVAGGMPRYLSTFGSGSIRDAVVGQVLDRRGGLFNEPAALLQNEVRTPGTYFAILESLSRGARSVSDVAEEVALTVRDLGPYLEALRTMRIVERVRPVGATDKQRNALWRCNDNFVRFWFRFVWPYQAELEAGADPGSYYDAVVEPGLTEHAAPVFESQARTWMRRTFAGQVTEIGAWWGPALNVHRRAKTRFTEEIDGVGVKGKKVRVVMEAKWTNKKMSADVLLDLLKFKLPALEQAGFTLTSPRIVLASRSGFNAALLNLVAERDDVDLVEGAAVAASKR